MTYREIGKQFTKEINQMLEEDTIKASFVTGGGYAYDSIKYASNDIKGDFDFMIIYDELNTVEKIISKLKKTSFKFEDKYLEMDLNLLKTVMKIIIVIL